MEVSSRVKYPGYALLTITTVSAVVAVALGALSHFSVAPFDKMLSPAASFACVKGGTIALVSALALYYICHRCTQSLLKWHEKQQVPARRERIESKKLHLQELRAREAQVLQEVERDFDAIIERFAKKQTKQTKGLWVEALKDHYVSTAFDNAIHEALGTELEARLSTDTNNVDHEAFEHKIVSACEGAVAAVIERKALAKLAFDETAGEVEVDFFARNHEA